MGIETVAAAITVGATAVQYIENQKTRKAQKAAAQAEANAKKLQAYEILDRLEVNIEELQKEGRIFKAKQAGAFLKGGVDLEGTPLSVLEATAADIRKEADFQRREAKFKADMLFAGADIDTKLGGDIKKAGKYEDAGLFLRGAADVYSIYRPKG